MRRKKAGTAVRNEHLRYRRRAHNHEIRRSRRTRHLVRNAAGFLAKATGSLVLVLVAFSLYEEVSTSPRYAIKEIRVIGFERRSPDMIRVWLIQFLGSNMFRVRLGSIAAAAEHDPFVLRAAVRRILPGTIEVSVTEREPAALVLLSDAIWLADKTGHLLGPARREDFPIVTGEFGDGSGAAARRIRRGVVAGLAIKEALPEVYGNLSEIHVEKGDGLRLVLRDPPMTLVCDGTKVARQLAKYSRAKNLLASYAPLARTFDLRFRDRLIAKSGDSLSNRRRANPHSGRKGHLSVEEKSHG